MNRTRWGLVLALMGAFASGCSSQSGEPSSPSGSTQGSSDITTQLHVSLTVAGLAGDVAGILYEISCDDGTTVTEYVPLEDELSPGFVTGGTHAFADLFQVLPAGVTCLVTATPMQSETVPSEMCDPASQTVTVQPNVTTELVLTIQCEGDGSTGAIDVVGTLNHPPIITTLDIDPSKFLLACETGTVSVTAVDPDGDPLTYTFTLVSAPANAVYLFNSNGNEFTFVAETPGTYIFEVAVDDGKGGHTTLQFPIYVQANPDCEHIGEICCQITETDPATGATTTTISITNILACEAKGGVEIADEACKEEICCNTADGPQIVQVADCPASQVLPDLECMTKVCCKQELTTGITYSIQPNTQCKPPFSIVPPAFCKEICCLVNGTAFTTTGGHCADIGGASALPELCQQQVCCRMQDGTLLPNFPATECTASGGVAVPSTLCIGLPQTVTLDGFTPDPEEPCEPDPLLVVPSTGNHKLAVFDTDAMTALPGSPFPTCSSPSRVIFDWNNDIIATCRTGAIEVQKHAMDGTVLWTVDLPGCTGGARGAVISPDGRLFVGCSFPATVHQLNHATGAILASIPIPTTANYTNPQIYGLMADATGVYVGDYFSSRMSKINLATLTVQWTSQSVSVYGFSADGLGNLWLGGATTLKKMSAADGSILNQWTWPVGASFIHGVQVAPDGMVYGSTGSNSVVKFDSLTEAFEPTLNLVAGDIYSKGVTAEWDNDVYSINQSSSTITKFFGGNQAGAASFGSTALYYPYAYSGDMTGLNLCQAGLFAEWFSPPVDAGASVTWGVISWASIEPPGTSITMYYRIDGGAWTLVTNGQNIGATGQVLELKGVFTAASPPPVPTLTSVTVQYTP